MAGSVILKKLHGDWCTHTRYGSMPSSDQSSCSVALLTASSLQEQFRRTPSVDNGNKREKVQSHDRQCHVKTNGHRRTQDNAEELRNGDWALSLLRYLRKTQLIGSVLLFFSVATNERKANTDGETSRKLLVEVMSVVISNTEDNMVNQTLP